MKTTVFYSNLLNIYSQIKIPPQYLELSIVDKHITYYLADDGDQFVSARCDNNNVIAELDIKSAFPTICRNLFGLESEFVQKMDDIKEKRGRLIYIATTLKEAGDYLAQLNIMCKAIVLGVIFELCENVIILELKKDGILFTCNNEDLEQIKDFLPIINSNRSINENKKLSFINFLIGSKFNFHLTEYNTYYRTNKTSIFHQSPDKDIDAKGKYKYMPKIMKQLIKKILQYEKIDLEEIREIYSTPYFKICQKNGLHELLDNYYICDNECVLDPIGNYIKYTFNLNLDPTIYLRTFIFPPLLSTKL
jgi:hypothetical protein